MEDQKNHSFISSSKLRKFAFKLCIFFLPVLVVYITLEFKIREIDFEPKIKMEYLLNNKEDIHILALGESQTQRSINPEYLDIRSVNLANSSQGIYQNFRLLKAFEPELPNLKLVILGLPFNIIQSEIDFTDPVINHLNLVFYKVNTFGRDIKPEDYLLFHVSPDFFSRRLIDDFKNESPIHLNKYGFDTNKIYGSYQAANFDTARIDKTEIVIENFRNEEALQYNKGILIDLIYYCEKRNIKVLFYSPPSHQFYNQLRDENMIAQRDSLVNYLIKKFPFVEFLNEEQNSDFTAEYFYNANHLNPQGAKKATLELNNFIKQNYDLF